MTPYARFLVERGAETEAADYAGALVERELLTAHMAGLFERYDLLLTPTACFPAFPNEEYPGSMRGSSVYPEQYWNGAFTLPINVIGHPAAPVPAGFSMNGLPIGLHIAGHKFDEATVLAASAAFERAAPWAEHRPPVS